MIKKCLCGQIRKQWRIAIASTLLIGASDNIAARETLHITVPPSVKTAREHAGYYPTLLRLALSKTESTDGPFTISEYPHELVGARFLAELKRNGVVDVIWAIWTPERDKDILAIRIPLLKELNSYRIFLIRKEDEARFKKISTLDELRQLKAGQGTHWSDTAVLMANNLPVVTSIEHDLLFNMLIANRFDYFPRGLDEVWSEENIFADKGLVIEPHLMLHYDSPKYFFVNKDNIALANRIERGLKIAIADGSFDKLFNSVPAYKRGHDEMLANKRLTFTLQSSTAKK